MAWSRGAAVVDPDPVSWEELALFAHCSLQLEPGGYLALDRVRLFSLYPYCAFDMF